AAKMLFRLQQILVAVPVVSAGCYQIHMSKIASHALPHERNEKAAAGLPRDCLPTSSSLPKGIHWSVRNVKRTQS
ncbi:MAG: hypothetical protein KUG69_04525, partial [Marinosulfonomonas sp.]|nr:hypothetical protein [Marinosulfonomonas sp.]